MNGSPDLSTFVSRLHLKGDLSFQSALRIGASRSTRVDEPDLPILRDTLGQPYIPGSSLKGALRSYVESVLRTLQAENRLTDRNLACLSVGKPAERPQDDQPPFVCLHQDEVDSLKTGRDRGWTNIKSMPVRLRDRLPGEEDLQAQVRRTSPDDLLDRFLRDLSCWSCRVFGAQWLAAKVLIRDLTLKEALPWPVEVRNGVAIDRDAGRAYPRQLYDLEVLPAGAVFELEILVENASPDELGLLWLGLSAFERGEILLGGARSRGLGWCRLDLHLNESQYVTAETLIDDLFRPAGRLADQGMTVNPVEWIQSFGAAIGATPKTQA